MKTQYRIVEEYGLFTPQSKTGWLPIWSGYLNDSKGYKIRFNTLQDARNWLENMLMEHSKPANRKIHQVIWVGPQSN